MLIVRIHRAATSTYANVHPASQLYIIKFGASYRADSCLDYAFRRKEKQMQITDIKIRKFFDEGPMKAVVSVTFNDCLAVHDIKVIYARDRYFIVMPSRKNPDGTYRDIVHPINSDFRAALEEAVIDAYHVQLVAAEHDQREEDDTYVI